MSLLIESTNSMMKVLTIIVNYCFLYDNFMHKYAIKGHIK